MKKVRVSFNLSVNDKANHKSIKDTVKAGVLNAFKESPVGEASMTNLTADNVQSVKKPTKKKRSLAKRQPLARALIVASRKRK